jgi:hypothetical protein
MQIVVNAARANDVNTLSRIYKSKCIDINLLIPTHSYLSPSLYRHYYYVAEDYLTYGIGAPALAYAAAAGNFEVVQLLLELGANPNMRATTFGGKGIEGHVLDFAKRGGNDAVIRLIRKVIGLPEEDIKCSKRKESKHCLVQ